MATTAAPRPVSAASVSRQLHGAGWLLIASADRHRRQGLFAQRSGQGRVLVGFSHHRIGARQRRQAAELAADLRALGYAVEVHDVPADDVLHLYVSRPA